MTEQTGKPDSRSEDLLYCEALELNRLFDRVSSRSFKTQADLNKAFEGAKSALGKLWEA